MDTTTTTAPGGPPVKKKPTPVAGYKAMVKKPGQQLAADTTKAPSPTNPIQVQKADGSIGTWGNPLPKNLPPVTDPNQAVASDAQQRQKQLKMSDKANGNSSTYYRANQ